MNIQTIFKSTASLKAILSAGAFVVLLSSFTLFKTPVNLSGEWKLNEGKSELGQFAQMSPKKIKVEATETSATIERTSTGRDGQERTSKETLTYDGKEAESTVFGNSKKKSTVKWSEDGKVMTVNSMIHFERNGQTTEITVKEEWKLAEDGKSLVIESTSTSSFGTNTTKLLFDKQ